jgi:hypothetical protein
MHLPWGGILQDRARIGTAVVTGVPATQVLVDEIGHATGEQKRSAVLKLVQTELLLAEGAAGRDLVNDPTVMQAAGALVDAYVNLHNVLAHAALHVT